MKCIKLTLLKEKARIAESQLEYWTHHDRLQSVDRESLRRYAKKAPDEDRSCDR